MAIHFSDGERQVLDWLLTNRVVEPADKGTRATCEGLVRRGFLVEKKGPDERFTVFVASLTTQKCLSNLRILKEMKR